MRAGMDSTQFSVHRLQEYDDLPMLAAIFSWLGIDRYVEVHMAALQRAGSSCFCFFLLFFFVVDVDAVMREASVRRGRDYGR